MVTRENLTATTETVVETAAVTEAAVTAATETVVETAVVAEAAVTASVKLTDVKQVIAFLADRFPKCFTVEGEAKPLKIGIFKDLTEQISENDAVSRTQLRQALRRYTSSWRYLKCIARGGVRIDLNGEQGDALEADHIDYAAKALEQSKAKFEESRKALRDKKSYKKSQNDTGEGDKKHVKLTSTKQRQGKTIKQAAVSSHQTSKRNDKKSGKKATALAVELLPLSEQQKQPGTAVLVKFGQSPVPGVIKEVTKTDVHVELNSGMVIKTKPESLFLG